MRRGQAGPRLAISGRMFARFKLPLTIGELLKRTFNETIADDVLNLAAQQAYYFFFALFPALLALISLASIIVMTRVKSVRNARNIRSIIRFAWSTKSAGIPYGFWMSSMVATLLPTRQTWEISGELVTKVARMVSFCSSLRTNGKFGLPSAMD